MKNIIIDCDPGHDDIFALLLALAHRDDINILGITTVCGNQTLDKVTNNILKVLDYLNIKILVAKGSDKPLIRDCEPQPLAHGESGLDGPILKEAISKPIKQSAIGFINDLVNNNDNVSIVALAPLTNIALFISSFPDAAKKVKGFYIMGGSINSGNILPHSEFNIYHDPEAAKIVFNSGLPIVLAPLEACYIGNIKISEATSFTGGNKVYKLVNDLFAFYLRYAIDRFMDHTAIFDVLPIAYLLRVDLFKVTSFNVDVEVNGQYTRGMTVFQNIKDKNNVKVITDVNRDEFIEYFITSITLLDKQI